jgi:hypothetical protein
MPNTRREYRLNKISNALTCFLCRSAINSSSLGDGIADVSGSATTGASFLLQIKGSASARPLGGGLIGLSYLGLPGSLGSACLGHHTTADDRFSRKNDC